MMVIILAGALGGIWLDGHFSTPAPYFTGGLTILSVIVAMYTAVKDLLGKGGASTKDSQ
ncbi:MAG: AtpZ/AtpI family protein [Flavobacteriales bacterium]|nr:AtpZ/AtpI family protein [Flavobacteriales bacterium]